MLMIFCKITNKTEMKTTHSSVIWKKAAKMALKYWKKVAEKYNKLLLIKHLTQSVFPLRGFVRLRGFS